MKKFLSIVAVLSMVLMLAACGDDKVTSENLNGEWVIDVAASAARSGKDAESIERMKEDVKGVSFKFDIKGKTVTFIKDGETESVPLVVESQKDNVFVLNAEGEKVNAVFEKKDGKDTLTLMHEEYKDEIFVLVRK